MSGVEGFRLSPEYAYHGIYAHVCEGRLDHCVKRVAACNDQRKLNAIGVMGAIVRLLFGKRIRYGGLRAAPHRPEPALES